MTGYNRAWRVWTKGICGIHIDFLDKYFLASMSYRCVTDRSNARTINCTAGLI